MPSHPELQAEQAYIDHAYESLEANRLSAVRLKEMVEVGKGGTEQARWEREVINDNIIHRLQQLHVGDASLVFGRIDHDPDHGDDSFYIGRVSVSGPDREPLVVDWRAPVAEAFYRATPLQSLGLIRRRHFATRGRTLLGIEDELFGDAAVAAINGDGPTISGHGALIAALETARTGRLGDIVATIQGEQDEIIRAELPGILVVQGGPGTGKTVVALHRAAYLLYTHRFPLEGQGVLVVGPNRLFLNYIEQVLPSLGEAGVELAVLADLIDEVRVAGSDRGLAARVKGDLRMTGFVARAVRDRERPLRAPLRVGYGLTRLSMTVEESAQIVNEARRRYRWHNPARKYVEARVYEVLAGSGPEQLDPDTVRQRLKATIELREALDWMWPLLSPAELLHDLFGSKALLRNAAQGRLPSEVRRRRAARTGGNAGDAGGLTDDEWQSLHRPRSDHALSVIWTTDDVALLDEARALLGPRKRSHELEPRTYGHIVVDEAQDLSPMALRTLGRRSLNGSMTIVGDIAQSTGAWAHDDWDEVLEQLPQKRPSRRAELTVGYRIPAPNMAMATRVLRVAAPELTPPRSVRQDGDPPRIIATAGGGRSLADAVVDAALDEVDAVGAGSVAVICPHTLVDRLCTAFEERRVEYGRATRHGLDSQITVVAVGIVKGLELDASVVVEPAAIIEDEAQGLRSLYVALTRSTKRLAVVHERPLPEFLAE
ncbi:MAG: AAA family ATPase [Acidimicrobiales bacterium]|nr:AAA family ATPase [Acidimicrobiales bacterium]